MSLSSLIDGPASAYRHNGDLELMTSLGLQTHGWVHHEWTKLGTVKLPKNDEKEPAPKIKVEVYACPAQFFRFTITRGNEDRYKHGYKPLETFVLETGSGGFGEYYQTALMIARNMLTVKVRKAKRR
jgi:hypothetical protein